MGAGEERCLGLLNELADRTGQSIYQVDRIELFSFWLVCSQLVGSWGLGVCLLWEVEGEHERL